MAEDRARLRLAGAVLGAAGVLWGAMVARFWFVADDAWITYRYSRNWALGRGILYNVGEPPVEGYSDFLWMAVGALVEVLRLPIGAVMPSLSAATGAALLGWVAYTLHRHLALSPMATALGTLALAASPSYGLWSTSGLETMPLALLVFVTFERLVLARSVAAASVAGLLLCLVRTEGPGWAAVIAGVAAVAARIERRSLREVGAFVAVVAVGYLPYFAWRYAHFGTWVANTVTAKVELGRYALTQGRNYVLSFWLALIAPAMFLLCAGVVRRRPSVGVPILLMAVAFPAFAVLVGGDYLPMGRLLVPGLPFAVLLAAWAASDLRGEVRPLGAALLLATVAVGVLPAFDVHPVPASVRRKVQFRDERRVLRSEVDRWAAARRHIPRWSRLGLAMRQVAEPGDTWVTGAIGAVGYHSDHVFIYDVGGLVNREVASLPWTGRERRGRSPGHEKTVLNEFFLDKDPTFLRAELVEGDDWVQDVEDEVARWKVSPEAAQAYVPDFREVEPIDGVRQFAVLLRRADAGEDPSMMWDDLPIRLELHGAGTVTTGDPRYSNRFDAGLTDAQRTEIAALEAIGYVDGDELADDRPEGVLRHEPGTAPGVNFLVSGHGPEGVLIDADGRELHRWTKAFRDVWPDHPALESERGTRYWRTARLRDDGSVVAIFEGYGIFAIDRQGALLWANANHAHHDIELLPGGELWTLVREAHVIPNQVRPILEDFAVLLGADGVEKRRISVTEALRRSPWADVLTRSRRKAGDLLHTNAVELLDERLAVHGPAFRAGNLLLSMRFVDLVAVLDPETERMTWAQQGPWRKQHDPHPVDGGRILLFDNLGADDRSRVIELDPSTGAIPWEYRDTPEAPFYSRTCGIATRLPNGNTLVTEAMAGRGFELSPDRRIVWEYRSTFRTGPADKYRARLFEVHRVPEPAWLAPK